MSEESNVIDLLEYKGRTPGGTSDHQRLKAIREIVNEIDSPTIKRILLVSLREALVEDLGA